MPAPTLPESLLEEIYAHCRGTYPEEGCGVLTGPVGRAAVTGVHPCANIQNRLHAEDPDSHPRDARTAYRIDPRDLFDLTRAVRDRGEELKGIFHSHADVGAYFSDEDQRQAAPVLDLSVAAFARGEGMQEAEVAAMLADGRLPGDAGAGRVRARVPTYAGLLYLVVDVTAGEARGVRGFRWDPEARTYAEVDVPVGGGVAR
jgi:proteasome lid subunit RPN8/RPN11